MLTSYLHTDWVIVDLVVSLLGVSLQVITILLLLLLLLLVLVLVLLLLLLLFLILLTSYILQGWQCISPKLEVKG